MATEALKSLMPYSVLCRITGTVVPIRYLSGPFLLLESIYSCNFTAFMLCKRLRKCSACSKVCTSGEQVHGTDQHTTADTGCSKLLRKACLVAGRQQVMSENRGRMIFLVQNCVQRRVKFTTALLLDCPHHLNWLV